MAAPVDVTQQGVRRVLAITLGLNLATSVSKIVVGQLTGSLAMVADGFHSLMDGANNVLGLVIAGLAYAPPDRGHPYGHRKFETAATVALGVGLLVVSYHVAGQAFSGVAHSRIPAVRGWNWAVMGITLGVNLFVSSYEAREGRRFSSTYLLADAAHTRSDIYVTLGVVASFAGARAGLPWVDGVAALIIAAFIAVLAVGILVGSFHTLTDRAAIPPEAVQALVLEVPGVRSCGEIRTRGGPGSVWVDLVVHVDGDLSLRAAHQVADKIEAALMDARADIVDVIVHVEPAPGP
jgi:cation diffusion facilitator family transporter